jgi:nuclear receptor coactivator 4
MDSADNLLYLVEEIRAKVSGLEKAVDDIHHVKKSLKVTSTDVKAHIRDSISRHLEALRNREIWLLSQVELIQQGKEDVLLQKQTEISEMSGGLKKVCALLEQSTEEERLSEVQMFEAQLSELLISVEKMSISPEENSNMCFKAHNLELLESIRGFGHVDTESSLEESQLTLLFNGINLAGSTTTTPSNKRKFYTSTGPMENWLLPGQKYQQNQPDPNKTSVEKWLSKCKPYCESEQEVASDMGCSVKSFDLSELKWIISAEANHLSSAKDSFGRYFDEIKRSTPEKWIKVSPKLPEDPKMKVIGESYSKIIAMGNENWLFYKQEKSNQRNFPENLGKIHELESSNLKWLQNSNAPKCFPQTSNGKAFSNIVATSMDQWLQPEKSSLVPEQLKCNSKSSCGDCSSIKDNSLDYTDSMSDADWLKIREDEVVSIENLDSIFMVKSKIRAEEEDSWLVGSPNQGISGEDDRSGIKKYNQMLQAQPIEDWLHSSKSKEIIQPKNIMKGFLDSLSNDYNKWLSKPAGVRADTCKWLARSSVERCKNCPKMCSKGLFSLFDDMKEASDDNWLNKSINN